MQRRRIPRPQKPPTLRQRVGLPGKPREGTRAQHTESGNRRARKITERPPRPGRGETAERGTPRKWRLPEATLDRHRSNTKSQRITRTRCVPVRTQPSPPAYVSVLLRADRLCLAARFVFFAVVVKLLVPLPFVVWLLLLVLRLLFCHCCLLIVANLPTYLQTYLPTYLPTFRPTYRPAESSSHNNC